MIEKTDINAKITIASEKDLVTIAKKALDKELAKVDNIWNNPKKNALLKQHQYELMERWEIDKADIDLVFADFWEKLNKHEVHNMIEYMASKGIVHKKKYLNTRSFT